MTQNQFLQRVAPVLLLGALGGCAAVGEFLNSSAMVYPETRVENLNRLHNDVGEHHYTVQFIGDVEHAIDHNASIRGLRFGAPSSSQAGRARQLNNPGQICFGLLDELLDLDSEKNPRLEAIQVAWCARVILQDPSVLSRERAVRGIASIGARRGAKEPYILRIDAPRASQADTDILITNLRSTWSDMRAGTSEAGPWKDSLLAVQQTSLDLIGCMRVLEVVADLFEGLRAKDEPFDELVRFTQELEISTICFAYGEALTQKSFGGSVVRAASVRALGQTGGAKTIATLMPYLRAEHESGPDRDPFLVSELLANVAQLGFPESIEGLEQERYELIRENWYTLLVSIAVTDPETRLRVKACQALAKVTGEPATLREEDWEDWLYTRAEVNQASEASSAPSGTNPSPTRPESGAGGS